MEATSEVDECPKCGEGAGWGMLSERLRDGVEAAQWVIDEVKALEQRLYGPVSGVQHLGKLDLILADRPAGKNIILHAVETIERLQQRV